MKTQNVDNIYRVYCDDNQAYQGRKVFVTKDFFLQLHQRWARCWV